VLAHLSRVEQIKRFRVLPVDWEPGGEELTPTMKLKRKPISSRYEAEIESLYSWAEVKRRRYPSSGMCSPTWRSIVRRTHS